MFQAVRKTIEPAGSGPGRVVGPGPNPRPKGKKETPPRPFVDQLLSGFVVPSRPQDAPHKPRIGPTTGEHGLIRGGTVAKAARAAAKAGDTVFGPAITHWRGDDGIATSRLRESGINTDGRVVAGEGAEKDHARKQGNPGSNNNTFRTRRQTLQGIAQLLLDGGRRVADRGPTGIPRAVDRPPEQARPGRSALDPAGMTDGTRGSVGTATGPLPAAGASHLAAPSFAAEPQGVLAGHILETRPVPAGHRWRNPAKPPGTAGIQVLVDQATRDQRPGDSQVGGDGRSTGLTDPASPGSGYAAAALQGTAGDWARPGEYAAQPPAQSPASARQVVMQLVSAISDRRQNQVEILLRPRELGKVKLSIRHIDKAVLVHVFADRPETLDLMRRNSFMLEGELRQMGYGDVGFSFSNGGDRDHPGWRQADPTPRGVMPVTDGGEWASRSDLPAFVAPRLAALGRLDLRI